MEPEDLDDWPDQTAEWEAACKRVGDEARRRKAQGPPADDAEQDSEPGGDG